MSYARNIRAWGLALVALFLLSGIAAANASAAEWKLNGAPITSAVATSGESISLELIDTHAFLGSEVDVTCSGTTTGTAGPGVADTTSTVTVKECHTVRGTCGSPSASPVDLPWKTELFEPKAGVVRDHILADGKGAPGYKVECTVFGIRESDTCTSERGQPLVDTGVSPVPITFDAESGTADCTLGGAGAGHVRGTVLIKSSAGTLTVG